jgi:PTS system ascorbate-specific IIA component
MTSVLAQAFAENSIRVGAVALDREHVMQLCGELLVASGRTTPDYTDAMLAALTELGPYFVIAPGIALAHAAPSEAVMATGLSLLTLAEPIVFGHESNDPVRLVVGLCAVDHDTHLELMAALAEFLADAETVNFVLNASDYEQIREMF